MTAPLMRVVRADLWIDPAFDGYFRERQGVVLDVFPRRGADEAASALLAQAHVYHVSAAKDELPRQWFVTQALLQRCPQLLCVSQRSSRRAPPSSAWRPPRRAPPTRSVRSA